MKMKTNQKNELLGFLDLLNSNNQFKFNIKSLKSRIQLQKYVYLAKKFGVDFNYSFNLYAHGPYSPTLADDYHSLHDFKSHKIKIDNAFFDLIENKNIKWLEIASTLLLLKDQHPDISDDDLTQLLHNKKSFASEFNVTEILQQLREIYEI